MRDGEMFMMATSPIFFVRIEKIVKNELNKLY